ncbi:hypothetical protein [Acinetobacter bereziniae]|uniref:hypothetical protein n=1 Tax=Acinetobacter bereziniae TaxID=106648 RepID=UPI003AF6B0EB
MKCHTYQSSFKEKEDECTSKTKQYPYYGLAPHIHTKPIGGTEFLDKPYPSNFSPDGDGMGVYTHCLYCGGDGTVEGVVLEKEEG